MPLRMENDANAALLGEAFAGDTRGRKIVVMLTLGTRIGGAVLLDGQIYHSAGSAHPEIGHIAVQPNGAECYCGRNNCFEIIAAGPTRPSPMPALKLASTAARPSFPPPPRANPKQPQSSTL